MFAIGTHVEKALFIFVKCSVPQSKTSCVIATCVAWYGRRVALTYAPGILANYCIRTTIFNMGSDTMGRFIGMTIVAPAIVPSLSPFAVKIATMACWWLTAVICNLFHLIIIKIRERYQLRRKNPLLPC